jgi:hypothetical protein
MKIELPLEVKELIEESVFDKDGLIKDDKLTKYLFYLPEVIRIYGTAIADLERQKKDMELDIVDLEEKRDANWASTLLKLDVVTYKNEDMRNAKRVLDSDYRKSGIDILVEKREIIRLDHDIEIARQTYYKFKNMQTSLSDLTKLRVSEKYA